MNFKEAMYEALNSPSGPKIVIDEGGGSYRTEPLPRNTVAVIDSSGFPMSMGRAEQALVNTILSEILRHAPTTEIHDEFTENDVPEYLKEKYRGRQQQRDREAAQKSGKRNIRKRF